LVNYISAIIDMVQVVNAEGMGEDRVAYQTGEASAAVKQDGTATAATDNTFAIAVIKPVLVSTLTYISKNIQRTTPVNYQARTVEVSMRALRRKIARMIVSGDPALTIPEITGVLKAEAIEAGSDVTLSGIDQFTLRKIALAFGGDDVLEGGCVLMLNKKDLIAFGDVRGTNEKKYVYEIEFAEGSTTTGTIKDGGLSVQFIINSECAALSATGTAVDAYTMLYGKALSYQLNLFGNYEVMISNDFKFDQGLIAVRGEALVGGNVVARNGWTCIKKGA
jgi:HK97 family phage major capsid protein